MNATPQGPQSYFPSIVARYGHPIEHWMVLLDTVAGSRHGEQVTFLKEQHGLGHGHANALVAAHRAGVRG